MSHRLLRVEAITLLQVMIVNMLAKLILVVVVVVVV